MPLPLQNLTFARMADVSPVGTTIANLIDAIHAAGSAATDYRGTALPASHLWTWTQRQVAAITEAVTVTPPAGTPMTRAPAIIWGGRAAITVPVTPTAAAPDVMFNSIPFLGISKNSGAYVSWDAAQPFGPASSWFGFWRQGAGALLAVTTIIRLYISQETIFIQFIQAGGTSQSWGYIGAIGEPYDNDTILSGETDNRLYGQITSGSSGNVSGAWLNTADIFNHSVTAQAPHMGTFVPNSSLIYACNRLGEYSAAGSVANLTTPSGMFAGERMAFAQATGTNTPGGSRMGTVRGVYPAGLIQSGRFVRNGATDILHYVSTSTIAADDGFFLPAVP